MPDSVYGPCAQLRATTLLTRFGVETTFYDPCIDEAGITALLRAQHHGCLHRKPRQPHLRGAGHPGDRRAAHAHGAKVLMDNTWGIHHFQPFQHGVDVSIQALTKYVVGHSDVLLGSVTVNSTRTGATLHATTRGLGQYASPDDCWLALRGVRTMAVRLARRWTAGIDVAHWLSWRPEVKQVLHPALPGAPGHAIWKRDFTGACSLFGVVFKPVSAESTHAFVDALELFGSARRGAATKVSRCRQTGFVTRTAGSGKPPAGAAAYRAGGCRRPDRRSGAGARVRRTKTAMAVDIDLDSGMREFGR